VNRLLAGLRRLFSSTLRRHEEETTPRAAPWRHYTDFSGDGEWLIGMYRVADGRQLGPKVELFRLPADHDETDVRVKIRQAMRQAVLANESWSSST